MSLFITHSYAQIGIEARPVSVEAHLSNGLPSFSLVGLPETTVREAKERVRCAIIQSGFEFPMRRITINLAPADLPKQGGRYDLAIAMALLAASGQIDPQWCSQACFVGELGLSGELRPVGQLLAAAQACEQLKKALCLASADQGELRLLKHIRIHHASSLLALVGRLKEGTSPQRIDDRYFDTPEQSTPLDIVDVWGQIQARRALEIAAAGGHNLLFRGPPGSGKSMLAERLPGILPPLNRDQAIEIAKLYSLTNQPTFFLGQGRPFRAPHHAATSAAIIGGGSMPMPGEISLAHHGVLFLDELPEFRRDVLEALREPLETGVIHIARAKFRLHFPARFQLIAAMNPCPCGYSGHPRRTCLDTPQAISRYNQRISGPLMDRFDMHIDLPYQMLDEEPRSPHGEPPESSAQVRDRVQRASLVQSERQGCANVHLDVRSLQAKAQLDPLDARYFREAIERLGMSMRGFHRILRVALTISDLAGSDRVLREHLLEALSLRRA